MVFISLTFGLLFGGRVTDYKNQKSIFLNLINEWEVSKGTVIRLIKLHGEILLLDEVLTISAEKSSLRTDPSWENEYNLAAKILDNKFAEAFAISNDPKTKKALQETRDANNRLMDIEGKSFFQKRQGNAKISQELLNSDEYFKNKAIYSDGLNTISLLLNEHIKITAVSTKNNIRNKLFLIIFSGILLMGSWILVWRSIVSWRRKLFNKNSELEQKISELEEFSYRTSHDLKAPLVNIRGLSRIMQTYLRDGDYMEVSENLQKIGTLSTRLETLIEDIEETARIDAENDIAEEVEINQSIEIIKEGLFTLIVDKEIEVITRFNEFKPIYIQKDIIIRVLENLISNAIKYSNPQRLNRFVRIEGKALNDKIEILVSDNGLGIPKEFHHEVFGMFKRFHKTDAPGSGLGLYLVKKNLEKINGKISLQSTSEGTTFKITLPILEATSIDSKI